MGIKLINRFQENVLLTFCMYGKCVNTVFYKFLNCCYTACPRTGPPEKKGKP
jgi:hypothetical protein